jgi:hypothetical protein
LTEVAQGFLDPGREKPNTKIERRHSLVAIGTAVALDGKADQRAGVVKQWKKGGFTLVLVAGWTLMWLELEGTGAKIGPFFRVYGIRQLTKILV